MKNLIHLKEIFRDSPQEKSLIRYVEEFQEGPEKIIILEKMDGSLINKAVKIEELSMVLSQIARFLVLLHEAGFVHLDIRPGKGLNRKCSFLSGPKG